MCLAIYQPIGDPMLPDDVLTNGWTGNPHGAGYMFAVDGMLTIRKPFYSLKKLRKAYMADHLAYGASSAFVMHFRWATHGSREVGNVHPHSLAGGQVGLVHNGIMFEFDWSNKDSDTATFCGTVLAARSVDNLMSPELSAILADMVGTGNKLVLMSHTGDVAIVNEKQGLWDGPRWYSNTGYLPPAPRPASTVWTPIKHEESVTRGAVFDSMSDAVAGFRRQFNRPSLVERLWEDKLTPPDNSHLALLDARADDEYEAIGGVSIDDEIDRIDLEIADAWLSGDDRLRERLEDQMIELERERDQWADAELAMARDGY